MKNTDNMFHVFMAVSVFIVTSCDMNRLYLNSALRAAGGNRHELEKVIDHYSTAQPDAQKLDAAKYLIQNMPAHYSYSGNAMEQYYDRILPILLSNLDPMRQQDSIVRIFDKEYAGLEKSVISDVRIIKGDYLIYSIDHAFQQWRTRPWARDLSFEEFKQWLLPYKLTDLQTLDYWRDSLSQKYSDSINEIPETDWQRNTVYGAIDIVRDEIHRKNVPLVLWGSWIGPRLLSERTMKNMTYGTCLDYVSLGVLAFRSLGLPSAVDQIPCWGRNSEGHSWYVFPSDRGKEIPTVNSLIVGAGAPFYQYERIPKVFRTDYAINRKRMVYMNEAKYVWPFDLCQRDVTSLYCRTSDLKIPIDSKIHLKDRYVYIAMAVNGEMPQWRVLDFGTVRAGKACFSDMGRNMLYLVLGFDGNGLVPVSRPFVLDKDGRVRYVGLPGEEPTLSKAVFRRKYLQSWNVVEMRKRLIGGEVQYSDFADFADAVTVLKIDSTPYGEKVIIPVCGKHRYWRYLSADGSYGSIAELELTDVDGKRIKGLPISGSSDGIASAKLAFDGDVLSNFETEQPNGNWVGLDVQSPMAVSTVRVVPRSDDNDIQPGLEYELFCWNGKDWEPLGYRKTENAYLEYEGVPTNTLLWLKCYSRGKDERPFIIDCDGNVTWW